MEVRDAEVSSQLAPADTRYTDRVHLFYYVPLHPLLRRPGLESHSHSTGCTIRKRVKLREKACMSKNVEYSFFLQKMLCLSKMFYKIIFVLEFLTDLHKAQYVC